MSYEPGVAIVPPPPLVSSFGNYAFGPDMLGVQSQTAGSAAWNTAKGVIYVPCYLPLSMVAVKLWWHNGNTISGNVDVGIYNSTSGFSVGSRIINTGSVAQAAPSSAIQIVDVTDTFLAGPNLYYLAMTMDNVTGTVKSVTNGNGPGSTWLPAIETTGAFGLPATATPLTTIASAFGAITPWFGFSTITNI